MSKKTFTLQAPQFSDSDTQTPVEQVLNTYDRQYSLIYQQIKTFLKQCKENINKYIQLNQFGARFNMFALYAQMTTIQTSTLNNLSDISKQQLQHQKGLKIRYQKQFQQILERMENVIKDFLKFEVDFKREYFGWNIQQPQFNQVKKKNILPLKSPILGKLGSQHSINSGSSIRHKPPSISKQSQDKKQTQLEQKLRQILKRKLAPQKQNIIKFCDRESDPFKNMLKLEQKIDMMQSQIILSKTRQQKIIDIFNKRRIQNIQPKGQNLIHCQLIQTDDGNGHSKFYNGQVNQTSYKSKGKIDSDVYQSQLKNSLSLKKFQAFSKPVLDVQAINSNKIIVNQQMSPKKIMIPNGQSTPRKLVSQKDMKSPTSNNQNTLNFFGSPRNLLSKKLHSKSPPIDFKKKKQGQQNIPQSNKFLHSLSQHNILFQKEMQKNRQNKLQVNNMNYQNNNNNQNRVGLDGGGGIQGNSVNKNREQFLMRRRSNNQSFHIGGSNWID